MHVVIIGHKVEADLLYKDSGDPKLFINVYANLVKSCIYFFENQKRLTPRWRSFILFKSKV